MRVVIKKIARISLGIQIQRFEPNLAIVVELPGVPLANHNDSQREHLRSSLSDA